MDIPVEIMDWFRGIFVAVNRRLAEKIRNVPAIPEPHLDTTFIEHLMGYAAPRAFPSGWAIRIDTHYLGGLRHFGSWEIADIGIFVFFQRDGSLIRQKVALLQSKRLYPTAGEINYIEEYDYRIGMARLAKRDRHAPTMMPQRALTFKPSSRYKALLAHDDQYNAIADYIKQRHTPVFYLLYNPPSIPLRVQVPLTEYVAIVEDPPLGSRIIPFHKMEEILKTKKRNYAPSITDVSKITAMDVNGWRLENFMADLLLGCKEGRRITDADASDMESLFYRRSGPIAATVAITVEVPKGVDIPE